MINIISVLAKLETISLNANKLQYLNPFYCIQTNEL